MDKYTGSYVPLSERRRQEMEEQKRLMEKLEMEKAQNFQSFIETHPPSVIESEINEYIIDQPNLTRKVADFLYYQALRNQHPELPARPMLIAGPSGSGKTEVWRVAKKLYSQVFKITFVNAANITSDGWSGSNKLANYITNGASDSILILDEADKMFSPRFSIGNVNTSIDVQSEFLKVIEENEYSIKMKNEVDCVIKNLGVVFIGAFESIREEKTQHANQSIGFASQKIEEARYNGITRNDLLKFGVISELVGRISVICNTHPLSKEQCLKIVHNSKSRLTIIADLLAENGIDSWKDLPNERIIEMIEKAETDKFGVRNVLSKIETIMLNSIHENGLISEPEKGTDSNKRFEDKLTLI